MPQCKVTRGRTAITLYEREAARFRQVATDLQFVRRNADSEALEAAADQGQKAIEAVLAALAADTPDQDEPAGDVKPGAGLAKAS